MDINSHETLQQQIDEINQSLTDVLRYSDAPVGSNLAKELNRSFGDLDLQESNLNNFIWGLSIWGLGRIGAKKNV